jgi:TRAP-type mannitol/chloroaromatic compound transport system substrate-binding protein
VTMAKYDHLNPTALRRLVGGGTQLRAFPRAVMDACQKAALEQYKDWSEKYPEFKTMYGSYSKYNKELTQWFRVAEGSFDNYMASQKS